jgi:hypothetical protein
MISTLLSVSAFFFALVMVRKDALSLGIKTVRMGAMKFLLFLWEILSRFYKRFKIVRVLLPLGRHVVKTVLLARLPSPFGRDRKENRARLLRIKPLLSL